MTITSVAVNGIKLHGAAVGLRQNEEPKLTADLVRFRDLCSSFDAARVAKRAATEAQNAADHAARQYLADVRHLLARAFGSKWNVRWLGAGFRNESTAIPASMGERLELLHSLTRFFPEHPELENASLQVTGARAAELIVPFEAARNAFAQAATEAGQTLELRDQAEEALRTRMRGLIGELKQLLSDNDPRWWAFGFNAPADPSTPSIPDGLVFTLSGSTAYLDWADSRRAERYRVWKQTVGVDAAFEHVDSVTESDFTLAGLPAGKVTRVQVTAVNAAGESLSCAPVEIAVA